ncbi:MAG: Flp pilus assembly complex ATPase component TadA [Anaerolineae bacterium]|nr:Flp pilus assembly complex ATPase component TadA [Anaerolineae bacterium]
MSPATPPTDHPPGNGHHNEPPPPAGISPIVPGRSGRPSMSLEALRERIERQFQDETANRADILLTLDTEHKRRDLLREVADYVIGVEAITLTQADKTALIDKTYRSLFTFGPLDEYLQDDTVTEITINGPSDIHVRRGMGRLEAVRAVFDDRFHLGGILDRVLASGGAALSDDNPFVEVGVVLLGRTARISAIGPPINPDTSLEIRLHPRQPILLDDLVTRYHTLAASGAALLRAILAGGHGLLIVGDVSLGKTTLAGALAHTLPSVESSIHLIAAERAVEMHLPPGAVRKTAIPPTPDDPGRDFGAQIQDALDDRPDWLIVDELRGDESAAVWAALTHPDAPRYIWVFRGAIQPDRLRSALTMLVRKTQPGIDQRAIFEALTRHVPFIAALKRIEGAPRVHLIAELVMSPAGDLAIMPLLTEQADGWLITTNRPTRPLDLPDDFWG